MTQRVGVDLIDFVTVAVLFYLLGHEHGRRRDRPPARPDSEDRAGWSPFDGFWSDR
jgi:hypothetical protein